MSNLNAIQYIINYIRSGGIPEEVLIVGMTIDVPKNSLYSTSVDERLTTNVIENIVLREMNVLGGVRETIPLDGIPYEIDPYGTAIFKIPYELTNGRKIIEPLGIGAVFLDTFNNAIAGTAPLPYGSASSTGYQGVGTCGKDTYLRNQMDRIRNAHGGVPIDYNTNLYMGGPNVVVCKGFRYFTGRSMGLDCNLEHDSKFNDINPKSLEKLAEACELATKMYIYTKVIIKLGEGYLQSGQELGKLNEIINSYESARQDYKDYKRNVLQKVLFMNDSMKMTDFISKITNSNF